MGEWPEFLFVGVPVLLGGAGLLAWQRRSDAAAAPEDEAEARHLANRSRRRTQVAIMIALIGAMMIGCGLLDPRDHLLAWWSMVTLIVLFAMWCMLLGLADLMATRATLGRRLAEVSMQREAIERELRRMKDAGGE